MAKITPAEAWTGWAATLSPAARAALTASAAAPPPDDEAMLYGTWRDSLSSGAKTAADSLLDELPAVLEPVAPSPDALRYCAVEVPNGGDWPALRIFRDVASLVRRMHFLEGSDISFFAFYGVPLQYTRGPLRYVRLEDGITAISVPLTKEMLPTRLEFDQLDDVALQDDNFLGCKELGETDTGPRQIVEKKRTRPPGGGRAEDEDYGDGASGVAAD